MSIDPDRIREEIETTRVELSSDVDALTYKVNPKRLATERVGRAQGRLGRIRDKVMGTATRTRHEGGHRVAGAGHRLSDTAHQATGAVSGAAHQASEAISGAAHQARAVPQMTREQTEGNPLAAGLIAFGVGLLAASLVPPSHREQQLAGQARHTAMQHSGQLKQQAGEIAHDVQENLRDPARQAAQSVRSTATQGASAVRDQGRAAAQRIQGQASEGRH